MVGFGRSAANLIIGTGSIFWSFKGQCQLHRFATGLHQFIRTQLNLASFALSFLIVH